jgi:hypothetical protein
MHQVVSNVKSKRYSQNRDDLDRPTLGLRAAFGAFERLRRRCSLAAGKEAARRALRYKSARTRLASVACGS